MILALLLMTEVTVTFVLNDDKKDVAAVCPVDGTRFTAAEVTVTNQWGGVDADGCPHAYKTTPLEFRAWVCPGCGFAGKKADFDLKLTDEEKAALRAGLKPTAPIAKGAKQADVPGWVKFDLAAQAARIRRQPPGVVGAALLQAAWSARQQGARSLHDFEEWGALETAYGLDRKPFDLGTKRNRTEFELDAARKLAKDVDAKKYDKGVQRTLSRYLAAYVWRKHGENVEAERWLGEVDRLKGENSIVDEAAAAMRASIERERGFLKQAIPAYEAAHGASTDRKASAETAYRLGELYRRTGSKAEAAAWYGKAIEGADADGFRKLIQAQQSLLR